MARVVGYFEDFQSDEHRQEVYSEGPFVLCNPLGNGWRIEAEVKGAKCPSMADLSIYKLREELGWGSGKTFDRELAERVCDTLNEMTRTGEIVLDERGFWRHKDAA